MENIVVIGASGHSKVTIDIVEKEKRYQIAGIIDKNLKKNSFFLNYPVFGMDEDLLTLTEEYNFHKGIIAVGDNWTRHLIFEKVSKLIKDFTFVNAIHPSAQIGKDVKIGSGTIIMPGVIINSESKIGDFCILNTNSSVDHDCILRNYVSLAPGVTIGGNVKIGEFSAVSIGATIIHGTRIGSHSVVGAGALVVKDIDDKCVVYGVPAKKIRDRKMGEKYL